MWTGSRDFRRFVMQGCAFHLMLICIVYFVHCDSPAYVTQSRNTTIIEKDTFYINQSGPEWQEPVERMPCAGWPNFTCYPLLDLYADLGWKEVVFVVDENSPRMIPTLTSTQSPKVQSIVIQQHVFSFTDWLQQQVTVNNRGTEETNITLFCSGLCVKNVISQVKAVDLELGSLSTLRTSTHWIIAITSGRLLDLDGLSVTLDNVLVLTPARTDPITGQVKPTGVYSLMWRPYGRSLDHVTTLTHQSERNVKNNNFWPNKYFGFNRRTFIFVTKEWSKTTIATVLNNGSKVWSGLYIDVLAMMQAQLNFSHIMIEPEDGLWGSLTGNSSVGLTGDVRTGKADVGLAQYFIVTDDDVYVDFASPIIYNEAVMVYRRPVDTGHWSLLMRPLSSVVLWLVFGSLIFVTVFLSTLETIGPCATLVGYGQQFVPFLGFQLKSTLAETLGRVSRLTIGALLAQGSQHLPEASSSRAVMSTWWIFCMIIAIAYSANMAAHLSVNRERQLLTNLRDLVSQSDYKWGVLDSSSIYAMMMKSNLSVYRQVVAGIAKFNKTDPEVLAPDDKQHLRKVMREQYVYLAGRRTVEAQTEVNYCELEIVGGFLWLGDSILLKKHSALNKPFSDAILRIHSSGLMDKLYHNWYPHHHCPDEDGLSGDVVITTSFLQGALYLAASGLLLAAVFLGLEILYVRYKQLCSIRSDYRVEVPD